MAQSRGPARKSTKAATRRVEILRVATRLFLEKGYEATSLQDIADEVGLLKGSLYYYISEKEDLLYAILEDMYATSRAAMAEISSLEVGALVKIRRICVAHVLNVLRNRDQVTIFFRDFGVLSEERVREISAQRDRYAKGFAALLKAAQAEAVVCPDVNVKLSSGSILGMLNMVHEWYPYSDETRAMRLAEEIADLVVASLRCDGKTHRPGHRRHAATA
ncbi:TetR/AcrR family transcriptional regulator [Mycobacterium sp. Aquia_216]|uniref:TetR/AcrR family transcriptional regulator n=1 Tax=Mycobacterium sp. Aquia_216 TaxID=2991729 RepID=UPI00227D6E42|nr:TetR/AcrR family transcriptional regulator [Mycobacterium sp. Aquia_216]WAJ44340.1 TetR/AcrR family transcriptional regulator [Mycobacterium sp. Aquia_216]